MLGQTSYEKGLEQGRRELFADLLEQRFGPLSEPARQSLESLNANDLKKLSKAILTASSLKELGIKE